MEAAIAIAQVHALLATRQPEPQPILRMASDRRDWQDDRPAIDRAMNVLWRHLPSDVQEGRDPSLIRRWVEIVADELARPTAEPPAKPLTVHDYALASHMPDRPSPATVRGWAKAAVDAFSDPDPTTEPS